MESLRIILFVIVCGLNMMQYGVDGCNCAVRHPQQKFCNADFVFVGTVKTSEVGRDEILYKIKVNTGQIFKGEEHINNGKVNLYTPYAGQLCGRPNLKYLQKYLISGKYISGKLVMTFCDWVNEWEEITVEQRKYLKRGIYDGYCKKCPVTGVWNTQIVNINEDSNLFHPDQISGMWSRYKCTYNPVASATHGRVDCETAYSFCRPEGGKDGQCNWKNTEQYAKCFKDRELHWVLRDTKEPAFTSIRDCRQIKTRQLKRKCVRTVHRFMKANPEIRLEAKHTIHRIPAQIPQL